MHEVFGILVAIAALAVFAWLLIGSRSVASGSDGNAPIDPNDPRQLGTLIGMTGGSIADAAVARCALERFEREHGRKATVRDMAIVAGMMRYR